MEFALRPAFLEDAPALARLGIDSFVAKFGALYRPEDLAAFLGEAFSDVIITAELSHPQRLYHVAEHEGALLGYCKLGLDCGFPQFARAAKVIELKQLYTAPDATSQGIGAALMDWAMAEAHRRGFGEMQLSVWSGNAGAQRFYARYGFTKVADVHFRVGAQVDDEFLFARIL